MNEEQKELRRQDIRIKDLERVKALWQDKYAALLVENRKLKSQLKKMDNITIKQELS